MLAQPHQEHCATNQGNDTGNTEVPARIQSQLAGFEANGQTIGLECGKKHRPIAGILVDFLAPLLTFLFQLLKAGHHGHHQLHDDGG